MLNNRFALVSVLLALVLAVAFNTAFAAPGASQIVRPACSASDSSGLLGVDGGLTALSQGLIPVEAVASPSSRPSGVDGGVLSLLFARSVGTGSVAASADSCTAAFAARSSAVATPSAPSPATCATRAMSSAPCSCASTS